MRTARKILVSILVSTIVILVILLPVGGTPAQDAQRARTNAQPDAVPAGGVVTVGEPVTPDLTIAFRDAPIAEVEFTLDREINPRMNYNSGVDPAFRLEGGPDPLLAFQDAALPSAVDPGFLTPLLNYVGQGYSYVNPPDTVGDVGVNEYIQMINGYATYVMVYDKDDGSIIAGPIALESLGSGGNCASGLGDPIVLYDELADRWLLSEFASSGNHLCVYISTSGDPTGTYYRYDFTTPNFPDYPKYAVWPDAYYVTSNENSPAIYALDRANMITGGTARPFQRFTATELSGFGFQALTPADLDGNLLPPDGSPAYFMRHRDTEVHGPEGYDSQDILEVWAYQVDFEDAGNSTFTWIADILVSEFDSDLCGLSSFNCFPQPGTSTTLDPLREVIMWRLQYRNFGNYETLVGNFVTDVNGDDRGGIRWFELRKIGASDWLLYQEGTYAPTTDAYSRWMGAVAMDGDGNIALGYNVSNSALYPSLRYAGRLRNDPLSAMPQGEVVLVAGTASNGSNRYGDYSAMSVDPEDDCTFWFTGMYNVSSQWSTRIGAFRFDACPLNAPDIPIMGLVASYEGQTAPGSVLTLTAEIDSGSNVFYVWDFGDGSGSSGAVVEHRYMTDGLYTATVTATNLVSVMEAVLPFEIVEKPIQGLSAASNSPTLLRLPTTLTATVTMGTNVSYAWDFGDDLTGNGAITTHTYPAIGNYTATVTATNSISTAVTTTVITIYEDPIQGLAALNDSPTFLGEATRLTAAKTMGSNIVYTWDFGDGALGTSADVFHTYLAVGDYTATLTATNSISQVIATTCVTIVHAPISGLSAQNDSPTLLGGTTTYTATILSGTGVTYLWDFGDGTSSMGITATHVYTASGVFMATVTASNPLGSTTAETQVTILPVAQIVYLPCILKE